MLYGNHQTPNWPGGMLIAGKGRGNDDSLDLHQIKGLLYCPKQGQSVTKLSTLCGRTLQSAEPYGSLDLRVSRNGWLITSCDSFFWCWSTPIVNNNLFIFNSYLPLQFQSISYYYIDMENILLITFLRMEGSHESSSSSGGLFFPWPKGSNFFIFFFHISFSSQLFHLHYNQIN